MKIENRFFFFIVHEEDFLTKFREMADSTTMYRLPPIIPANMEFDLPTRMYKLPVVNNFGPQEAEISKVSSLLVLKKKMSSGFWNFFKDFFFKHMNSSQKYRMIFKH